MTPLFDELVQIPHWEIIIRPGNFSERRIPNKKVCFEIIKDCMVRWRGWNYPHLDRDAYSGKDYIQSDTDARQSIGLFESWQFYQSAQFVHRIGLIEDHRIDETTRNQILSHIPQKEQVSGGSLLSILNTLYLMTEAFEFGFRLVRNIIADRIVIEVKLFGSKNRTLFYEDPLRTLFNPYTCKIDIVEPTPLDIEVDEFANIHHEKSIDTCVEIFEQFNWYDVPRQVLEKDQLRLIEQKF